MATGIHVQLDAQKMRGAAQVIQNQLNIIRNCYESIKTDAMSLRNAHWDSASANNYFESIRILCSDDQIPGKVSAGSVAAILSAYVSDLNMIAEEFSAAETIISDKVESLPTNAFVV